MLLDISIEYTTEELKTLANAAIVEIDVVLAQNPELVATIAAALSTPIPTLAVVVRMINTSRRIVGISGSGTIIPPRFGRLCRIKDALQKFVA